MGQDHHRLALVGLSGASVAMAAIFWITWYGGGSPVDAWAIYNPTYGRTEYAYIWSPAFAQLTTPLRWLPFDAFAGVVRGVELVSLVAMAPFGAFLALWLPPVASEINAGNINLVLMAVVVLSFRWPAAWALPLLTKPSLGVGLLWYVVRREWRHLAIALGVTGAIAAVSIVADPSAWGAWIVTLTTFGDSGGWPFPWPIWWRLPIAAALVVWGARTNRPWTVGLAAVVAMPRLYFMTPAMLIGVLPLLRRRSSGRLADRRALHRQGDSAAPSSPPSDQPEKPNEDAAHHGDDQE